MTAQTTYPLGHSTNEIARLEVQSRLFNDPLLKDLVKRADDCLEIGTGVGSNYAVLEQANPGVQFIGIDNSLQAIASARKLHKAARFEVMDATNLGFANETFNLVLSKLVLWSVGLRWHNVVTEAHRVLKMGGVFYAFEPFNKGVVFAPKRPTLEILMQRWDEHALQSDLDPFIGPKVPAAFLKAGFSNIQSKFFPVLALSQDREKYFGICDNLRRFYFGDSQNNPGMLVNSNLRAQALEELYLESEGALVMDSFFVTWGYKL